MPIPDAVPQTVCVGDSGLGPRCHCFTKSPGDEEHEVRYGVHVVTSPAARKGQPSRGKNKWPQEADILKAQGNQNGSSSEK